MNVCTLLGNFDTALGIAQVSAPEPLFCKQVLAAPWVEGKINGILTEAATDVIKWPFVKPFRTVKFVVLSFVVVIVPAVTVPVPVIF